VAVGAKAVPSPAQLAQECVSSAQCNMKGRKAVSWSSFIPAAPSVPKLQPLLLDFRNWIPRTGKKKTHMRLGMCNE